MANNNSGGVSELTILQIVFIALKLVNVIQWKWRIVFLPYEIALSIIIIGALWAGLRYLFNSWFNG